MKRLIYWFACTAITVSFFVACNKDDNDESLINRLLFPVEQDVALGARLDSTIEASPSEYNILSESEYPEAYGHIKRLRDSILKSPEIRYRDEFEWEVHIIHDDETLNAFAAPGGFIYVYTGLIRYLESEDQLAGVMGHEIAHADRRHSINQLKKQYGVQILLDVVLGENQGLLTEMAANLILLSNSREDESEADEYSVKYLCSTQYNAAGAAGFFEKISAGGSSKVPEFLSTHPNPDNRVENIYAQQSDLSCDGELTDASYQAILNSLP